MLVTSVFARSVAQCREAMVGAEAVELRLDAGGLDDDGVRAVVAAASIPVLATYHGPGGTGLLRAAVMAGAAFVDIPLARPDPELLTVARGRGCRVVVSHHDYATTPPVAELRRLVDACFAVGADIAKVACTPGSPAAAARLIGLLDDDRPVVALGMGAHGVATRVAGALLGSPLVFVAAREGEETAPGQLDGTALRAALARLSTDAFGEPGPGCRGV